MHMKHWLFEKLNLMERSWYYESMEALHIVILVRVVCCEL